MPVTTERRGRGSATARARASKRRLLLTSVLLATAGPDAVSQMGRSRHRNTWGSLRLELQVLEISKVPVGEFLALPLLEGGSACRWFPVHSFSRVKRSLGLARLHEATNPMLAGSCECAALARALALNRDGTIQGGRCSDFPTGPRVDAVERVALVPTWRQPTIRASACRLRAFHVRTCLGPSRSSSLLTGGRIRRDPTLPPTAGNSWSP